MSISKLFFKKKMMKEDEILNGTILNRKSSFAVKEAYNAARTNTIFSLINEEGCKKIVVSSPSPGDGKSTTCLNLAITFAHAGSKVLIIDGDMRKPKLHKYLDVENTFGLSNVLGKFCEISDAVRTSSEHGLDYISAGPVPPNSVELLCSKTFEEMMENLSGDYDYIFIDTPPINIVTDAITFSKLISGIVLVVRQNITTYEMLQRAVSNVKFANVKILGFILNNIDSTNKRYRYDYKYKLGYGYSSYSYDYEEGVSAEAESSSNAKAN